MKKRIFSLVILFLSILIFAGTFILDTTLSVSFADDEQNKYEPAATQSWNSAKESSSAVAVKLLNPEGKPAMYAVDRLLLPYLEVYPALSGAKNSHGYTVVKASTWKEYSKVLSTAHISQGSIIMNLMGEINMLKARVEKLEKALKKAIK
jgi:hypothetical protein